MSLPWPGRPFSLKRKERSRASPACVCVSACDGEMRGGWREVGVLVSLKSVTHRIGMTSLPKKPGSLLFSSGLLLFRSQTLSLPPPPFFFTRKELFSEGGFQHNRCQNQTHFCAVATFLFLCHRAQRLLFQFILLYKQICINASL